jgi:hypothetical protein
MQGSFRKMMVHTSGTQIRNDDYGATGFTGQMDFTVVWHSVTSNDLSSKTYSAYKVI